MKCPGVYFHPNLLQISTKFEKTEQKKMGINVRFHPWLLEPSCSSSAKCENFFVIFLDFSEHGRHEESREKTEMQTSAQEEEVLMIKISRFTVSKVKSGFLLLKLFHIHPLSLA